MPDPSVLYRRDDALGHRVNAFLQETFDLPVDDYYARLDGRKLLGLKAALSAINNALTLRLTVAFLDWVSKVLVVDEVVAAELRATVLSLKPGSNGFDVSCNGPVPFVAEVKCNVPINNGAKYGSAQRSSILKDIAALRNGKPKAAPIPANAFRFMVFLDLPEVRKANEHLLSSSAAGHVQLLVGGDVPEKCAVIYAVHLPLA